jgi:hypothetical protein
MRTAFGCCAAASVTIGAKTNAKSSRETVTMLEFRK